jgi:DNA-binding transcriptional LysR family regulator
MARDALPDLSLRDLALLVEVGNLGSVREAARRSSIEPANLSRVLKKIEERLGTKVFESGPKGVALTSQGQEIHSRASSILGLASGLRAQAGGERETLTFGCMSFLAAYLLPPALSEMNRTFPKISFRVLECAQDDLIKRGIEGSIQVALHAAEMEWTRSWETHAVGSLRYGLFAASSHPLAHGGVTDESQVLAYPFVFPTLLTPQGYRVGTDRCPALFERRTRGDEASTAGVALQLLRYSEQLCFLPEVVARQWVVSGDIAEIEVMEWPKVEGTLYLSARSDVVSKRFLERLIKSCSTASGA